MTRTTDCNAGLARLLRRIELQSEEESGYRVKRIFHIGNSRFCLESVDQRLLEVVQSYLLSEDPTMESGAIYRIVHFSSDEILAEYSQSRLWKDAEKVTAQRGVEYLAMTEPEWNHGTRIYKPLEVSDHLIVSAFRGRCVTLVTSRSAKSDRYFMRVVREIAYRDGERSGLLMMHAAAVSVKGAGVLICGPKGAGKTTLALMLLLGGSDYIANDRVMVEVGTGGTRISGFPTGVRLSRELSEVFWGVVRGSTSPDSLGARLYFVGEKVSILPRAFIDAIGVGYKNRASLAAILVPETGRPGELPNLSRLPFDDAYSRILPEILSSDNDHLWPSPWILDCYPRDAAVEHRRGEMLQAILGSVPVWKLRWYFSPAHIRALSEEIVQLAWQAI